MAMPDVIALNEVLPLHARKRARNMFSTAV